MNQNNTKPKTYQEYLNHIIDTIKRKTNAHAYISNKIQHMTTINWVDNRMEDLPAKFTGLGESKSFNISSALLYQLYKNGTYPTEIKHLFE